MILRAIINEGALRRQVGGPAVMRSQISRIAEMAKLPNVTVQVLPFSAGAHSGMRGPFTALWPEEPMNTVYLELYGARYTRRRRQRSRNTPTDSNSSPANRWTRKARPSGLIRSRGRP